MEISGETIQLRSRKSFFQASRDLLRRSKPSVQPLLDEEFTRVSEYYDFVEENNLVRKEKVSIFMKRKAYWSDKSTSISCSNDVLERETAESGFNEIVISPKAELDQSQNRIQREPNVFQQRHSNSESNFKSSPFAKSAKPLELDFGKLSHLENMKKQREDVDRQRECVEKKDNILDKPEQGKFDEKEIIGKEKQIKEPNKHEDKHEKIEEMDNFNIQEKIYKQNNYEKGEHIKPHDYIINEVETCDKPKLCIKIKNQTSPKRTIQSKFDNLDNDSLKNKSHENEGHENEGHENEGHENDSHENDSHENEGHENDIHENEGHEKHSHMHENVNLDKVIHETELENNLIELSKISFASKSEFEARFRNTNAPNFRKIKQLSKAKKIWKVETKLRNILEEPGKDIPSETIIRSLHPFLQAMKKCLVELSKNSTIWADILLEMASMIGSISDTALSMEHKLTFMEVLHAKGLARCHHQVCGNAKPSHSVQLLQEQLKEARKIQDETQFCNVELREQLNKLEHLVREEKLKLDHEKERRRSAETELMMTAMEAGALRRKLDAYLRGGPEVDPYLLQMAFKKCREELGKRTSRLQEIELRYKDVVPRNELERCQKRYSTLSNIHEKLASSHEQLQMKYHCLEESFEVASGERDEFRNENDNLRRSATPRPDWNRVAEHIDGGIHRWHELSSGRTSDQLLDIVMAELTGSTTANSAEFLSCQGNDENVPAFLRYEGCVRNKRLGKRDVLLIIQDVWKERRKNRDLTLAQFLDSYFRERYHLDEVRAEWCYSLADACQRLAHEEQIGLFWGILCGQVQELVYHHQEQMMVNLLEAFKQRDVNKKGIVTRAEAEKCVEEHFPLKSEAAVQELKVIVLRGASSRNPDIIKYSSLFTQDETKAASGMRLPLFKILARQSREEQEEYVAELLKTIKSSAVDVYVDELRRAFTIVDPHIEQSQLDAYISWVFNAPRHCLQNCEPIPLGLLVARLQTGLIIRVGKRN